jgi:hypothetical protein
MRRLRSLVTLKRGFSTRRPLLPLYEPLERTTREIRLLELLPAKDPTANIRCILRKVSLDTKPIYLALSYVWGDATNEKKTIEVNGIAVSVTSNLHKALLQMRPDTNVELQTYWVDALCINQADNDEKSSQIQFMREIYGNAAVVVIWLGELQANAYSAMATIYATSQVSIGEYDEEFKKELVLHALGQEGALLALGEFFQLEW